MTSGAEQEAALLKYVKEADRDLDQLLALIAGATKDLNKGEADPTKCDRAIRAIVKFLNKYKSITKVKEKEKALDRLSPDAAKGVLRTDTAFNALLKNFDKLQQAKKQAKLDPAKPADQKKLIKVLEDLLKECKPPQGVGQLLKTIKQGTQPQKVGGKELGPAPGLSVLPMAIVLWMIFDLLRRAMKKD